MVNESKISRRNFLSLGKKLGTGLIAQEALRVGLPILGTIGATTSLSQNAYGADIETFLEDEKISKAFPSYTNGDFKLPGVIVHFDNKTQGLFDLNDIGFKFNGTVISGSDLTYRDILGNFEGKIQYLRTGNNKGFPNSISFARGNAIFQRKMPYNHRVGIGICDNDPFDSFKLAVPRVSKEKLDEMLKKGNLNKAFENGFGNLEQKFIPTKPKDSKPLRTLIHEPDSTGNFEDINSNFEILTKNYVNHPDGSGKKVLDKDCTRFSNSLYQIIHNTKLNLDVKSLPSIVNSGNTLHLYVPEATSYIPERIHMGIVVPYSIFEEKNSFRVATYGSLGFSDDSNAIFKKGRTFYSQMTKAKGNKSDMEGTNKKSSTAKASSKDNGPSGSATGVNAGQSAGKPAGGGPKL